MTFENRVKPTTHRGFRGFHPRPVGGRRVEIVVKGPLMHDVGFWTALGHLYLSLQSLPVSQVALIVSHLYITL